MPGQIGSAGSRLEEYVRFYLPQSRSGSIAELCRQSDITRNTMYGWFSGNRAPSGKAMERLAAALGRPVVELWSVWEGKDLEPATLEAAVAQLVEVQAQTNEQLTLLVQRLDALATFAMSAQVAQAASEVRRFALSQSGSGTPPHPGPAEDET